MNFVKILKLLWIYISNYYENSYQLQDVSTNFNFFTECANHNEQHNGEWKSSIKLKLVILSIPCNKC